MLDHSDVVSCTIRLEVHSGDARKLLIATPSCRSDAEGGLSGGILRIVTSSHLGSGRLHDEASGDG